MLFTPTYFHKNCATKQSWHWWGCHCYLRYRAQNRSSKQYRVTRQAFDQAFHEKLAGSVRDRVPHIKARSQSYGLTRERKANHTGGDEANIRAWTIERVPAELRADKFAARYELSQRLSTAKPTLMFFENPRPKRTISVLISADLVQRQRSFVPHKTIHKPSELK